MLRGRDPVPVVSQGVTGPCAATHTKRREGERVRVRPEPSANPTQDLGNGARVEIESGGEFEKGLAVLGIDRECG